MTFKTSSFSSVTLQLYLVFLHFLLLFIVYGDQKQTKIQAKPVFTWQNYSKQVLIIDHFMQCLLLPSIWRTALQHCREKTTGSERTAESGFPLSKKDFDSNQIYFQVIFSSIKKYRGDELKCRYFVTSQRVHSLFKLFAAPRKTTENNTWRSWTGKADALFRSLHAPGNNSALIQLLWWFQQTLGWVTEVMRWLVPPASPWVYHLNKATTEGTMNLRVISPRPTPPTHTPPWQHPNLTQKRNCGNTKPF